MLCPHGGKPRAAGVAEPVRTRRRSKSDDGKRHQPDRPRLGQVGSLRQLFSTGCPTGTMRLSEWLRGLCGLVLTLARCCCLLLLLLLLLMLRQLATASFLHVRASPSFVRAEIPTAEEMHGIPAFKVSRLLSACSAKSETEAGNVVFVILQCFVVVFLHVRVPKKRGSVPL